MRTVVITNPSAGRAHSLDELEQALAVLPDCTLRVVEKDEDPGVVVCNAIADGAERVVAAGGDGTIHAVVTGLEKASRAVEVGIIPLGTGNDLARTLAIPLDLPSAIAVIAAGKTRAIDTVRVTTAREERVCVNASAGGFAGLVDEKLENTKSGWLGPLAYLRSALSTLLEVPTYEFTLTADDHAPVTVTGCNLVVANGRSVAGGVVVAPRAVLDDGLVDVTVFKTTRPAELALLVPKLLAGTELDASQVHTLRCARLKVEASPAAPFNSDGELIGDSPVTYDVRHRGLTVIVP